MVIALLMLGKIVTVPMPVGQNAGLFYYASIMWSSVCHEYLRSIAIHYLLIKIRWSVGNGRGLMSFGTLARGGGPWKTATATIVTCVTDPVEPRHLWIIKKYQMRETLPLVPPSKVVFGDENVDR